ncbi:HTH CenpB-type DNA-binding domain [Lasallia pustulata]|uniref:HTH CenpB-type DNA-binding domain n=1 Tax=Lasallia pustulata TaxID=136370 RepID=A0A1W5DBZ8_9LECA|nr:HTH CenpB-type DNA-binding domain [Lasallia pustulata]
MSDLYDASELRVEEAIEAFNNGQFPSAAAAAKAHDIEPRRLQRRLKGQASRSTRQPTCMALTVSQEKAICKYIEGLDQIDMSPTIGMLKGAAEYLLQKSGSTRTVSQMWPVRFLERHPQYLKRKQKPLAVNREQSHSSKFQATQPMDRPVTPPPLSEIFAQTPSTTRELIQHGEELSKTLKKLPLANERLQLQVNQFIRGSIASVHSLQLSERDLLAIREEANVKASRKKLGGRVAQKSGVITVKDVRAKTMTREQDDVVKARRALAMAEDKVTREQEAIEKKWTKAWKAIGKELRVVFKTYKKSLKEEQIVWRSIHVEVVGRAGLTTLRR